VKVCSRCGRRYEAADRFCQFCGIALSDAPLVIMVEAEAPASSSPSSAAVSQPISVAVSPSKPTIYATQKWNPLAILSLITALVGLTVVAIPLGHIGMSQIKRFRQKGRGLAIAGLIIGYVVFTFWTVSLIVSLSTSHS
jgi:hypothetical protein